MIVSNPLPSGIPHEFLCAKPYLKWAAIWCMCNEYRMSSYSQANTHTCMCTSCTNRTKEMKKNTPKLTLLRLSLSFFWRNSPQAYWLTTIEIQQTLNRFGFLSIPSLINICLLVRYLCYSVSLFHLPLSRILLCFVCTWNYHLVAEWNNGTFHPYAWSISNVSVYIQHLASSQ